MSNETSVIYEFGRYRLDPGKRRLTCDGMPLSAPQQSLLLLALLVENAGRVVSLDEMSSYLLSGQHSADSNVETHLAALRRVLEPELGEKPLLRSIPGKGYRFEAPVSELLPSSIADDISAKQAPPAAPTRDVETPTKWGRVAAIGVAVVAVTTLGVWGLHFMQTSGSGAGKTTASVSSPAPASGAPQVAILPFQTMTNGPDDEKLTVSLTDAIVSSLAKDKRVSVLPPSSATNGGTLDAANGGQEMNIRILVRGMVQCIGTRVFVNTQVLSSQDGTSLWTGQLDGRATEIPDLAARIATKISKSIPDNQPSADQ